MCIGLCLRFGCYTYVLNFARFFVFFSSLYSAMANLIQFNVIRLNFCSYIYLFIAFTLKSWNEKKFVGFYYSLSVTIFIFAQSLTTSNVDCRFVDERLTDVVITYKNNYQLISSFFFFLFERNLWNCSIVLSVK